VITRILRRIAREVVPMILFGIAFSVLFILGHLAIYQTWPRWK
jgi:hypothetical protein